MITLRNALPPQEILLHHFTYAPDTGLLSWKTPLARRTKACDPILGVDSNGHRQCQLFGIKYMQHRIIWKMMTGEDPEDTVDHEDGVPDNNIWTNLRKATMAEQSANRTYSSRTRVAQNILHLKSGYVVDIGNHHRGTWRRSSSLPTLEDAIQLRNKWGEELYGNRWRPLAVVKSRSS